VGKHTGLELFSLSLVSSVLWLIVKNIGNSLLSLFFWHEVGLSWLVTLAIEFLGFPVDGGGVIEHRRSSLCLLAHHGGEGLLLLPLDLFVTPHALVSCSLLSEASSTGNILSWSSKHSALPFGIFPLHS
jgi:hypothetical protein